MRNGILVFVFVLLCFVCESILAELFGRWFKPNLFLIVVVFFNLFRGVRYSIAAGLMAGLIQDSMSASLFGKYIFAYVLCAYVVTYFKGYVYSVGSRLSRVLLVSLMAVFNVGVLYVVQVMFLEVNFAAMVKNVLLPEVLSTAVAADYVFGKCKTFALKSFV